MDNNFEQTNPQGDQPMTAEANSGKKGKKDKAKKKKGKKGLVIGLVIGAAVIGIAAYGAAKVKSAVQTAKDSMGTGTVVEAYGEKDMSTYVDVTGTVESQNVENVYTNLTYPVKEIRVKVGDTVKKGDVLCTIDTDEIDDNIEQLEAQASDDERIKAKQIESASHSINSAAASKERTVDEANQAIDEARKAFEDADADYYEKLDAYNQAVENGEPQEIIDTKKSALDLAEDTWYVKQYAYDQATSSFSDTAAAASENYQSVKDSADVTIINNSSSYSQTSVQLAKYYKMKNDAVIIAETSGVVTSVNAVEGVPANGVLLTIQDDKNLELNVGIREKDYFSLKEGMNVEISNSALENVTGKGTVTKINNFASADTSASTAAAAAGGAVAENNYKAKITVSDFTDMMIGMKVKVRIATGEEMRTKAVPYTAILTDAEGDYVYVAVEVSNGMYSVEKRYVDKGMSGDYYTQVTGGDLEEGDLVVSYPSTVNPTSIITINEAGTEKDTNSDKNSDTEKDTEKDSKEESEKETETDNKDEN